MNVLFVAIGVLAVAAASLIFPAYLAHRSMNSRSARLARSVGVKDPVMVTFAMRYKWFAYNRGGGLKGALLAPLAIIGVPVVGLFTDAVRDGSMIWAGGIPREWCTFQARIKTVTNLRSGVVVIKETSDDQVSASGAASVDALGVLSEVNWSNKAWDVTTAPAIGDIFDVHIFCGALLRVRNGANLAQGVIASTSATGRTAAASTITKNIGYTLCAHDGSGTEGFILLVGGRS